MQAAHRCRPTSRSALPRTSRRARASMSEGLGRTSQQWVVWDRPTCRGGRVQARGWVTETLAKGLQATRTVCRRVHLVWSELAARVGAPSTARDELGREEHLTADAIEDRNLRMAFTFGTTSFFLSVCRRAGCHEMDQRVQGALLTSDSSRAISSDRRGY